MSLKSVSAPKLRPHHLLLLILALQGVIGLGYAVSVPLWQGHEQDYFNVIRFLVDNGRLPGPADYPAGDADIRQATQPPLYFFAAALPVALFDDNQPVPLGMHPTAVCLGGVDLNPTLYPYLTNASYDFPPSGAVAAAYGLRILGVVFGMAAVAFTYLAGRNLFPAHPAIALAGAALLAFEPNTLSWSAIISNDTLLLTLAAANLWLCARLLRKLDFRLLLAILFTAALAVLTRLPGWAILGFDVLVLVAVIGRALLGGSGARLSRRQAQIGLIGLGLLFAAGGAVALFNVAQYGNVFGRYSNLDRVIGAALQDFRLPGVTLIGILDHTRLQYAGPLQMILPRELPVRMYGWLLALCLIAAAFGGVRALVLALRRRESALGAFALLFAAALAAVVLVVLRNLTAATDANTTLYNTAYIFAPLRYYTPGLPAFALLFAAGLWVLMEVVLGIFNAKAELRHPQRSVLVACIALVWLVVAAGGVAYHFVNRPPDPRVPALPADAIAVDGHGVANQPQLLAYTATTREGIVDLTLYLTAEQPLTTNYAALFQMVNPAGQVVNRCELLPTGGVYPPTRWRPGEIIAVQASIPNCAGTREPPLELTLGWLPASVTGELAGDNVPAQPLMTLSEPLGESASCPPNLGTVGGSYQITRFNSPIEVRRGETYLPSLNWLVLEAIPDVEVRVFIFRHRETGTEYICNTATYWASQWVRGEAVYFDSCSMTFPPDAPLGEYIAYAGLQNINYHWLPAMEADGTETFQVDVGSVQVVE
jgi:hypothetical protein